MRGFTFGWNKAKGYLSNVTEPTKLAENAEYAKQLTNSGLRRGSQIIRDKSTVLVETVQDTTLDDAKQTATNAFSYYVQKATDLAGAVDTFYDKSADHLLYACDQVANSQVAERTIQSVRNSTK